MDDEPQLSPHGSVHSVDPQDSNGLIRNAYELNAHCIVCRREFQPESETNEAFDAICICRDCKTIVLDDLGTNATTREIHRRRQRRGRVRQESWESIEDLFLQEFSQLINLVRQNPGAQLDGGSMLNTPSNGSSSRNRSVRWRRALSDTESDGHDHMDSLYGETDSNFSFSGYGGESDASVDGHSFMDREMFIQFDDESHVNTDTDIDPMHTGLDPWNSDDQDEDDGEWEEVDIEEEVSGQMHQDGQIQDATGSPVVNRGRISRGAREDRRLRHPYIFSDVEESEMPLYIRRSGDYLDGRRFEGLLEHLAEADDSRRGAPPTAVSFVGNLPCVIVSKDHGKDGDLICAICKDPLLIGTGASQLPCFHFYHPPCIRPWLTTRNSCPVCRYELPTDDHDYEEGKRSSGSRMESRQIRRPEHAEEESSSSASSDLGVVDGTHGLGHERLDNLGAGVVNSGHGGSNTEGGGRGWLFLAAAPIVSIVGVAIVLWLGKPVLGGRRRPSIGGWDNQQPRGPSSINPSSVNNNSRNRRWWSFL